MFGSLIGGINASRGVSAKLLTVLRLALATCFCLSGIGKIQHPYEFLLLVMDYNIAGPTAAMIVAGLLPCLELTTGICLASGIFSTGALLLASIMGAVFVFAQSAAIHNDLTISCGCFGSIASETQVNYSTLIRSVAVLIIALIGLMLETVMRNRIDHGARGKSVAQ